MRELRADPRAGLESLATVTSLLQRNRVDHPTAGLFEAADLQWWWAQQERPTDDLPQLFWFDDTDRPVAAIILTATRTDPQLDPVFLPGADPDLVAHVVRRGLGHAHGHGYGRVTMEVDRADRVLRGILAAHGLAVEEDGLVECWLDVAERPEISPLPDGYRLASRAESSDRPHHMIHARREHRDPEPRLRQTSLYRPDLDLAVYDADDRVAAYGLFWYDPVTASGLVEPMRTEDEHQRRGLARHVLTTGLDRLAAAGAERVKICFEPDNPASSHLYLDVGFTPDRTTELWAGPTRATTTTVG